MIITLNIDEGTDYTYNIEDMLKTVEYEAVDRSLWVYDSSSKLIWWFDRLTKKWHSEPTEDRQFYMTHLYHCGTTYTFEGTTVNTSNYLSSI